MQATTDKLMKDLRTAQGDRRANRERIEKVRARAEESLRNARTLVDGQVRQNPWTAVGVAAAIGLVAGIFISRK